MRDEGEGRSEGEGEGGGTRTREGARAERQAPDLEVFRRTRGSHALDRPAHRRPVLPLARIFPTTLAVILATLPLSIIFPTALAIIFPATLAVVFPAAFSLAIVLALALAAVRRPRIGRPRCRCSINGCLLYVHGSSNLFHHVPSATRGPMETSAVRTLWRVGLGFLPALRALRTMVQN